MKACDQIVRLSRLMPLMLGMGIRLASELDSRAQVRRRSIQQGENIAAFKEKKYFQKFFCEVRKAATECRTGICRQ